MHISLEQQLHVLAKQACLGDAHAMDCFARLSLVLVKLVARERLHGNRLARWMDDSDIAQIVVFRACRRIRPSRVGSTTPPKIFWLRSNRISPLDSCLSGNCAEAVARGQKSVFKWARTPKPYAFDSTPCSAPSPPRTNCVTSDYNHLHIAIPTICICW